MLVVAGGALLTLVSVGIPAVEQVRRQRQLLSAEEAARVARARLQTAFNDTLAPVAQQIAKVATATSGERREAMKAQSVSKVLHGAVNLVDADRSRACWFELVAGPPRSLQPRDHAGRAIAPTTVLCEGTPQGDSAFAALDHGEGRYVPDVETSPPAGWDASLSRAYRTFIAVPVTAGSRCFGMLTLDSLQPADLTGDEVPLLRLLADLLADALAIGESPLPGGASVVLTPAQGMAITAT